MAEKKAKITPKKLQKKVPAKKKPVISPKKTVSKKAAPKTAKKALKKTTKKKTTAVEISATSPLKKKAQNKFLEPKLQSQTTEVSPEVVLPTNVSLVAKSKAATIASLAFTDFKIPAQRIAFTAGFCFILFGALLSITSTPSIAKLSSISSLAQLAGTISGTTASTTQTITNTTSTATVSPPPAFKVIDNLPSELSTDEKYIYGVTNALEVKTILQNKNTLEEIYLDTTKLLNDRYQFFLPASQLTEGDYIVRTKMTALNNQGIFYEKIDTFSVRKDLLQQNIVTTSPTSTTTTATTDPSASYISPTTNTTAATTTVPTTIQTTDDEIVPVVINDQTIEIRSFTTDIVKPETLYLYTPVNLSRVSVFIRKELSKTLSPIGYAVKSTDRWLYRFDPANTPNGTYEIIAKGIIDSNTIVSKPFILRVNHPVIQTQEVKTLETNVEASPVISEENAIETRQLDRPVATFDDVITTETISVPKQITSLLEEYRLEINELLKTYSVAQQSGDKIMLEAAREAIKKKREELVTIALLNPDLRAYADDLDRILTERFASTQAKIDVFEQLRRNASNQETAVDTDRDGVSDFDEINLYRTNKDLADTDGDGVIDGIEIASGFNPLDPNPEAVVRYQSPKDSLALVDTEILTIENVIPVVMTSENDDAKPVLAQITGRGIPNSYITLYVFSTPTVVTVKTDAEGTFVYTFESELEDGEHEVYVAVTDNTGEIVAQSTPYRFVKEAQAFTPSDQEAPAVVGSLTKAMPGNPYVTVVGLGILGLGLILLMLGLGLRTNQPTIRTEIEAMT